MSDASAASDDVVIRLQGVGKMYRIFPTRLANLLDAVGLASFWPGSKTRYRELWALRGIDLALKSGSRIGIIGRNGAGKTTLLKLLTGNLEVTEGLLDVRGSVHALMDTGSGFHPEFTGVENVSAALTLQGLANAEIDVALQEIAEFTELGPFLNQPLRTYSAGMQARLSFATATAIIRPKVLIIDEILGAGDAYFLSKSRERMGALVDGGATVLLVSHSLDHIVSMCDEALWIDRGRIVERGPALEIVKAYQAFMRTLDDRRLRAKNRKAHSAGYEPAQHEGFGDRLTIQFEPPASPGGSLAVSEVRLLRDGQLEDQLLVGEAQDSEPTHSSHVLLEAEGWSPPLVRDSRPCRLVEGLSRKQTSHATVALNLYSLDDASRYAIGVCYAAEGGAITASIQLNGRLNRRAELADTLGLWHYEPIPLEAASRPAAAAFGEPGGAERTTSAVSKSRWQGEGGLRITHVRLTEAGGIERAVFSPGETLRLEISFEATRSGGFEVIPVAVLYRLDGLLVSRYVGAKTTLALAAGEGRCATLAVDPLRLGNGYYVFTVALYRTLDLHNLVEARFYDLLDRSYEFGVEGTPPMLDGVFHEPGAWDIEPPAALALPALANPRGNESE
jgi:lipopolysaccharide transport system ATP-binding protein